jgi:dipeptidyl aminopeptidase/acylaminoacyl peptidase
LHETISHPEVCRLTKATSGTLLSRTIVFGLMSVVSQAAEVPLLDAPKGIAPTAFTSNDAFVGLDVSPNGQHILTSGNASGEYRPMQIDTGSGQKTAWGSAAVHGIAEGYLPGARILIKSDQEGNEIFHLVAQSKNSSGHDLVAKPKLIADFQGWSDDHRSFFMGLNETDPRFFDLYEVDATTLERQLLMKGGDFRLNRPGFGNYVAVSPGRHLVAVEKVLSNVKSDVYVHVVATGVDENITASGAAVMNRPLSFSRGGDILYYVTDENSEYLKLVGRDLLHGTSATVIDEPADVEYVVFSRSGAYAVVGLNRREATEVRLYAMPSWHRIPLAGLPSGVVRTVSFAPGDRYFALLMRTPRTPGDVYLVESQSGHARMVASAWPKNFRVDRLVAASVHSFKSFDGLNISGILYVPPRRPIGAKRAVIWVHGGPNGQSELDYQPLLQFLALRGYVVYAVNHRGSTGDGKTFARLDDRHHGEDDLKDFLAARDMLVREGLADSGHVAIGGGSFGGYLTLAAVTTYPHAFAAAIDMFGIADWNRVLTSTPKSWASRRIALTSEIGDPDEDGGAYLRSISPIHKLDRLSIPIIVVQGANDTRVPKAESDTVVEAAKHAQVPVEYLVFPDEGHNWPVHKSNEVTELTRVASFLDAHL